MALILWSCFQNGTRYPKGTVEIAYFRQYVGKFSGPRPSAHSYCFGFFFLPSPNILNKEDVGRKYKMRDCPSNPALELSALFRAAGKCPFTFGIQSPYSLQRVSAHQNDLNNLGKAPGVFSERALTLSEERLAVVDLHIRHPPAEGPQTFLISPYQQSGT